MSETDKYCPSCDARRSWYDDSCPECGTTLVPLPDRYALDPDRPLETVLTSVDPGVIHLARLALDQAGIEFVVSHTELTGMLGGRHSTSPGGSGDVPWAVQVRQTDAAAARELLADLDGARDVVAPISESSPEWADEPLPVELFDSADDRTVGGLTEQQLEWLSGQLDEGAVRDREIELDPALIDSLEEAGAETAILETLRRALGDRRLARLRWALR